LRLPELPARDAERTDGHRPPTSRPLDHRRRDQSFLEAFGLRLHLRDEQAGALPPIRVPCHAGDLRDAFRHARGDPRMASVRERVACGLAFGAAVATKWSGIPAALAAIVLCYAWERTRRKRAGLHHPIREAIRDESFGIFVFLVVLPLAVYVASYAKWFADNH